ncbi:MAG TPA: chemotaxis protein CheW [Micropepsaceae bacterium]|nr:chemotaxis protein CheW [Micropepsaceae bacterium]
MVEIAGGDIRRFVTFRVGSERYAVAAENVAEVIRMPLVSRVPQSPRALLGVANVRGTVLPVASVSALLGRDGADAGRDALVFEGASSFALSIESVEALSEVAANAIDRAQGELNALPGERIEGVFRSGAHDAVTKIVDVGRLVAEAFARVSPAPTARIRTAREVAPVASEAVELRKLVTFDVAGQEFALELRHVREIIAVPGSVTNVPSSEAAVFGVVQFRQRLVPLFSLRSLLGLPTRDAANRNVIITVIRGALAGLVVDGLRAVIGASPEQCEELPPVLGARMGGEARISEIYRAGQGRLVAILTPEHLFRGDVMQRLREIPEAASQDGHAEADADERQFVIFRLGEDEYALPIEAVDEVGRVPSEITRLPRTPGFLEGVANLRGDVLPVLDQRKRFDMPAGQNEAARRLLVVRSEKHRAGLIVDGVSEVLRVGADAIDTSSADGWDTTRLVHGVVKEAQSQRLIVVLNAGELLSRSERALLDAFEADQRRPGDDQTSDR